MTEEHSLSQQISDLSQNQAQQAVLNLYELLPDNLWIDSAKWPLEDMEIRAALLQNRSPESAQPLLSGLIEPGNEQLKAEMSKALLLELASADATAACVRSAVEAAQEPDMFIIPLLIGAVIVFLALVPTKIETKNFTYEAKNLEQVAKIAESLATIAGKSGLAKFIT
jgi:hypothetical protein